MSFTTDSPSDLTVILDDFCSTLEKVVISLHQLQTASVNANNGLSSPLLREEFGILRHDIHSLWSKVGGCLEQGQSFSHDAITLAKFVGIESFDECSDFLSKMVDTANRLFSSCQALVQQSDGIVRDFDDGKDKMLELFRIGTVIRPDEREIDSVYDAKDSMFPDGSQALETTRASLYEAHTSLILLSQFWRTVLQLCRTLALSHIDLTMSDFQEELWTGYKDSQRLAICQVQKFAPRILIEPPILLRNDTEMSTPSTSSSLQSRGQRSSRDDEERAGGYWGVLLSKRRRTKK